MYKENKAFFLSDVSFESVYRKRGRIFSENKEILLTPVKRKMISPIPRSTYSMILFTITESPFLASFILFSWGLTFGLDNVSRQKLIPKYRSKAGIAMAFGVISLIAGIVSMISPTIGAWVWTNYSPQSVFYASAAINVLGSLPLFILWLYQRKGKN
jgi:predicted MFS family arabinose efflux permease